MSQKFFVPYRLRLSTVCLAVLLFHDEPYAVGEFQFIPELIKVLRRLKCPRKPRAELRDVAFFVVFCSFATKFPISDPFLAMWSKCCIACCMTASNTSCSVLQPLGWNRFLIQAFTARIIPSVRSTGLCTTREIRQEFRGFVRTCLAKKRLCLHSELLALPPNCNIRQMYMSYIYIYIYLCECEAVPNGQGR